MVAEIMKGLNQFFSKFGTAYIETSIPENVSFPYITYKCGSEDWKNKALISCSIYSNASNQSLNLVWFPPAVCTAFKTFNSNFGRIGYFGNTLSILAYCDLIVSAKG